MRILKTIFYLFLAIIAVALLTFSGFFLWHAIPKQDAPPEVLQSDLIFQEEDPIVLPEEAEEAEEAAKKAEEAAAQKEAEALEQEESPLETVELDDPSLGLGGAVIPGALSGGAVGAGGTVAPGTGGVNEALPTLGGTMNRVSAEASAASRAKYIEGLDAFNQDDYERARQAWIVAKQLDPGNSDADLGLRKVEELMK